MKKLALLVGILLISGCKNLEDSDRSNPEPTNVPDYTAAPEDVVDMHGEIENLERFEEFKANTDHGIKDKLRIVQYTTEGDPILHELEFDGEVIRSTIDTSRDAYGSGEIYHNTCTSIEVVEGTDLIEYNLVDCDEPIFNTLLVISK